MTNYLISTDEGHRLPDAEQAALATDLADSSTAIGVALMQTYTQDDGTINALDKRFGAPGLSATLTNALDAAEAAGVQTVVKIPGKWDVGNGLSMSGRSAVLQGNGNGGKIDPPAAPAGSIIYASTQSGPVIDWSGWVAPDEFGGKVRHSDFLVLGSGVADVTKKNTGMSFLAMSSVTFADISIRGTGGPCIDMKSNPGNAVYLCDFDRIIMYEPIDMNANDVPFMVAVEPNCNRFRSFGLRAMSLPVAPSGAVRIMGNSQYPSQSNLFDAWWFEGLKLSQDGTIFEFAARQSQIRDFQFVDCGNATGSATGTSFYRFLPSEIADAGGNTLSGEIPGNEGGGAGPSTGVDMRQSHNRVIGTRGYNGSNVTLASGVFGTDIDLGGSTSGVPGAGPAAVIDNSGETSNTVKDASQGLFPLPAERATVYMSGRYYGPAFMTLGTASMLPGYLCAVPFYVSSTVTFNEMDIEVITAVASTSIRLGVYANDPAENFPTTVILDAGTVDASTAGVKTVAISQTLTRGLYWLAAVAQGPNTPTVRSIVNALEPVVDVSFFGAGGYGATNVSVNYYYAHNPSSPLGTFGYRPEAYAGAPKIMLKAA